LKTTQVVLQPSGPSNDSTGCSVLFFIYIYIYLQHIGWQGRFFCMTNFLTNNYSAKI